MARRYIGQAVVELFYVGTVYERIGSREQYKGRVTANGLTWRFTDLCSPVIGFDVGSDSPEAYDQMAECAAAFASSYCGEDADPSKEDCQAFEDAMSEASDPCEGYRVKRSKNGPYRKVRDCRCTEEF